MGKIMDVKNLCKSYIVNKNENVILSNVSFSMEEGELVAVMGPSGSGKSTLLYSVSGMDEITSGTVEFNGKNIESISQSELASLRLTSMGFIFQQMYMLKNLNIFDNIILPAYEAKKESKKEINDYAKSLMMKTGISEVSRNDISEVSGGQLQRACICRSMINHPKMLFADEPTGSLNKQMSLEIMDEIIRVNREGTSVMLVTHDSKVAAKADRVLYIQDGNILDELNLGKYQGEEEFAERDKKINSWLMGIGW